jgi:hypothetical protein
MSKVKEKKAKVAESMQWSLVNPYAAGIDIGDKEIVVAVPKGLSDQPVRTFGTMTCDLLQIVEFLKGCEIETVAMESTGVYWKPLFSLLVGHRGISGQCPVCKKHYGQKDGRT